MLGKLLVIKSDQFGRFLEKNGDQYSQYQGQVCLIECLLVKPFDFEERKSAEGKYGKQWWFQIHLDMWESLRWAGAELGLDVKNVDQQAQVEMSTA